MKSNQNVSIIIPLYNEEAGIKQLLDRFTELNFMELYEIIIEAEGIGKLKEQLEPEVMRVVFKDSSFANAVVKTNALQVLKQFEIDEVVSV